MPNTSHQPFFSGIPAVDQVSSGLLVGDNVVWRINSVDVYQQVSQVLVKQVLGTPEYPKKNPLPAVYFRFANHDPVLQPQPGLQIVEVHPEAGFENFITQIHRTITTNGPGGVYVFDSLSDLQETSYSDRMIGNFFRLTCPYLRLMDTVAYFSLNWGVHSAQAIDPIRSTTQVWLDAYLYGGVRYLQAIKTREGFSQTHHGILYRWAEPLGAAAPVQNSAMESFVRHSAVWRGLPAAPHRQVDVWDQVFMHFQSVVDQVQAFMEADMEVPANLDQEHNRLRKMVIRMIMTNDPKMYQLALEFVPSVAVLKIWRRMVGSGFIGGKAAGMITSRRILMGKKARIVDYLEDHDSFYIGSDVFYSFLVDNDCWWDRLELKNPNTFLHRNKELQTRMIQGEFSQQTLDGFQDILDYYGGSPIIVRSSSLLEDNYGNAFAGKYESIFCTNQGNLSQRLNEFCAAVKRIYAGTMSTEALEYRRDRGVLEKDEQMALLVQRVSGRRRGRYFFPDLAGTVVSYNAFAWHRDIDPQAGMARIVMGLGTRAVDRVADDFPWVVSLNAPLRNLDREDHRSRQRHMDVLDLGIEPDRENTPHLAQGLQEILISADPGQSLELPDFFFERDWRRERQAREYGLDPLTVREPSLNPLMSTTDFAETLREAARILRETYGTHVELEFTAQWDHRWDANNTNPWINILQCRPFQMRMDQAAPDEQPSLPENEILLRVHSPVIGRSRHIPIHTIIWIEPKGYSLLDKEGHYRVARQVGQLVRSLDGHRRNLVLLGPGRWGTSTPAMGVPVEFGDIRRVQVLGEMDWMHPDLSPDISLGTHFFHDLVEADMLFVGLRQSDPGLIYRLEGMNSQIEPYGDTHCIRWISPPQDESWWLYADPVQSLAVVYKRAPVDRN